MSGCGVSLSTHNYAFVLTQGQHSLILAAYLFYSSEERAMRQPNLRLRVKELAQARGWTIDSLAREVGISTSQMVRLYQNRSQPSYITAWQLARILNVTIEELAVEERSIPEPTASSG